MSQNNNDVRFQKAYKIVVKHYIKETLRNWKTAAPGILLPAFGTIFVFYIPAYAVSKAVEIGLSGTADSLSDFQGPITLFVGSWLLGEAMWRVGIYFANIAETRGVKELYRKGLRQLLNHDLAFFNDNFAGSLTKRTLSYANRYIDAFDTMLYNVFPNLIPSIFAIILLSTYSLWLGLILLVSVPLILAIILPRIKHRRKLVTTRETASTVVSGHIADVYGNISTVRAHASEDREQKRHMKYVNDLTIKIRRSWDYQNLHIDTIISPMYVLVNAAGLTTALYLAIQGEISYAALIVVYSYFAQVTRFLWEFNGIYRRIETAISDAAQYTELLLDSPSITDPIRSNLIDKREGAIAIKDIHFAYEDGEEKLFDHFSLNIPAGQKVGLVGRSGSGKTSMTKLLLRFTDIDEGSITIDDVDIRTMTQADLRSLIAYVPQDPAMFHRSISDNIMYGKPNATDQELLKAAKMAHAHEFIEKLNGGYDTLVGERGIKLSGGQRQRVAIARAMLKDAPILLLDEATSALDSESELLIQDALWKLMENKTAIVIAHRLSTIQKMDRIIVMDEGRIIEDGSHTELLRLNGVYAQLWSHQSGGFLEE